MRCSEASGARATPRAAGRRGRRVPPLPQTRSRGGGRRRLAVRPAPPPPTPTTATAAGVEQRRALRAWCWCGGDEVEGGRAKACRQQRRGPSRGRVRRRQACPRESCEWGEAGLKALETGARPPPHHPPGAQVPQASRAAAAAVWNGWRGRRRCDRRVVCGGRGHSAAADTPSLPDVAAGATPLSTEIAKAGEGWRPGRLPAGHSRRGGGAAPSVTHHPVLHDSPPPSTPHPLTRTGDGRTPDEWAVAEGLVASVVLRRQQACERRKSTFTVLFTGAPLCGSSRPS